jgi:hypothetical protein
VATKSDLILKINEAIAFANALSATDVLQHLQSALTAANALPDPPPSTTLSIYFADATTGKKIADLGTISIDKLTNATIGASGATGTVTYQISKTGWQSPLYTATSPPFLMTGNKPYAFSSPTDYTLNVTAVGHQQSFNFTVSAASTPAPTPTPTPVPTTFIKGVCGGTSKGVSAASPIMKDLHCTAFRPWETMTIGHAPSFSEYAPFAAAGFKVAPVVTLPEKSSSSAIPTYDQALAIAKATVADAVKNKVWALEILNEPNLDNYFPGHDPKKVVAIVKAFFDASRGTNLKIIGPASASAGTSYLQSMLDQGLASYCDYLNCHLYFGDAAGQINAAHQFKALADKYNRPIGMTEWNLHASNLGFTKWSEELAKAYAELSKFMAFLWYFHFTPLTSQAGPASLVNADYSKHEPFYSMYRAAA